jgi:hypothetical protein
MGSRPAVVTADHPRWTSVSSLLCKLAGSERYEWAEDVLRWNVRYNLGKVWASLRSSLRSSDRGGGSSVLGGYRKVLVIRINHHYAGLFAHLLFALNQLRYCEEHNYLPVVRFGRHSTDGDNPFFDPARGENVWDYYFEPVSQYTYADMRRMIDDPKHPLTEAYVTQLSDDDLWYLHEHRPASIFGYPYGFYRIKLESDAAWYRRQRQKAHALVTKYVRVKPHILQKVDRFHAQTMHGHHVLGIHMRGTDKGTANASARFMRIVGPDEYVREIDSYSERNGRCRIFVATDQEQYLRAMKERYGERIISSDCVRSGTRVNPFQVKDGRGYQKGEEALIDCLLLSRCRFLLVGASHLSETAMYFNPELGCLNLQCR